MMWIYDGFRNTRRRGSEIHGWLFQTGAESPFFVATNLVKSLLRPIPQDNNFAILRMDFQGRGKFGQGSGAYPITLRL